MAGKLKAIPFGERPGDEPYNASEVVCLADSRFLFCDNNVSDALFEFRLLGDGTLAKGIRRRRIEGLGAGAIDDIEGIEVVKTAGRTFIFATSSLSLKARKGRRPKKKRGKAVPSRESILRIEVAASGRLRAEIIPDFRPWLVDQVAWLRDAARLLPDDGGLNVEALSWDPRKHALLFGLRTPSLDGKPVVLCVKPRKIDGPWSLDNLEVLEPLRLDVPDADTDSGIRAMTLDWASGESLIIIGNATSRSKARFRLFSWNGNTRGTLRQYQRVRFHKRMKVEGVTRGAVRGRPAMIFVDDGGGYQFVWSDDPLLADRG
jgi:hypothetical protein